MAVDAGGAVDADDVGVSNARQQPALVDDLVGMRVGIRRATQQLERDLAIELGIPRAIDVAEGAAGKVLEHLEMPEPRRRSACRRGRSGGQAGAPRRCPRRPAARPPGCEMCRTPVARARPSRRACPRRWRGPGPRATAGPGSCAQAFDQTHERPLHGHPCGVSGGLAQQLRHFVIGEPQLDARDDGLAIDLVEARPAPPRSGRAPGARSRPRAARALIGLRGLQLHRVGPPSGFPELVANAIEDGLPQVRLQRRPARSRSSPSIF